MQQSREQQVHGSLRLGFVRDQQRTRLVTQQQRPPLQVIRAFPLANGGTLLHLHNISGGVLGGDRFSIDVDVGPGAYVQLTSTSATRLYRCPANLPPAQQICTIRVEAGGLLEYLPDPLIPFAGSRYRQDTGIELAQDAGLFWWEIIAPGRGARGEIFAYDLLQMNFAIAAAGCPIAHECFKLEPGRRAVPSPARLGAYRYSASFYICRVGVAAAQWIALEQALSDIAQPSGV